MNETLTTILDIPFGWRVAIVMFAIWCLYALFAGLLLKLVLLVPRLFNWIWYLIYRLLNNLTHILHHNFGRTFIEFDQTITDFFGGVHSFVDKVKMAIENTGKKKIESNGNAPSSYVAKKPFLGLTFLIIVVLTVWISLPTWLHVEQNKNAFTALYHKYVEIEDKVLNIVFNGGA